MKKIKNLLFKGCHLVAKDSKQKKIDHGKHQYPSSSGLLAKVIIWNIIWENIIWSIMWENMNMFMFH